MQGKLPYSSTSFIPHLTPKHTIALSSLILAAALVHQQAYAQSPVTMVKAYLEAMRANQHPTAPNNSGRMTNYTLGLSEQINILQNLLPELSGHDC